MENVLSSLLTIIRFCDTFFQAELCKNDMKGRPFHHRSMFVLLTNEYTFLCLYSESAGCGLCLKMEKRDKGGKQEKCLYLHFTP